MGTLNGLLRSFSTNSSYALIDWTGRVGAVCRFYFWSSRHFRFGCEESTNGLLNGLKLLKLGLTGPILPYALERDRYALQIENHLPRLVLVVVAYRPMDF